MLTKNSTNVKFVVEKYCHEEGVVVSAWKVESQGLLEVVTEAQLASHLQYSCIDMQEDGLHVTMAVDPTLY